MKNVLDYLTWEHVELGVRITGCDKSFEGSMVIPDHINGVAVVKIGEKAFAECEKITSVVIPDTVKVVGKQAFRDCSSLRRVVLPSILIALARDAFDESVDFVVYDDI